MPVVCCSQNIARFYEILLNAVGSDECTHAPFTVGCHILMVVSWKGVILYGLFQFDFSTEMSSNLLFFFFLNLLHRQLYSKCLALTACGYAIRTRLIFMTLMTILFDVSLPQTKHNHQPISLFMFMFLLCDITLFFYFKCKLK